MKLTFNLANSMQQRAVGPVDAKAFLELECSSKMAFGVAIATSLETCPGNIKPEDLPSLLWDYGRMPDQNSILFEQLLKRYLVNCLQGNKELARSGWAILDHFFTDHSGDKAFRRLVERNAELLYGEPVDQEKVDRFIAEVKTATTIEWE